jgi:hypothetical protein
VAHAPHSQCSRLDKEKGHKGGHIESLLFTHRSVHDIIRDHNRANPSKQKREGQQTNQKKRKLANVSQQVRHTSQFKLVTRNVREAESPNSTELAGWARSPTKYQGSLKIIFGAKLICSYMASKLGNASSKALLDPIRCSFPGTRSQVVTG